MAAQAIAARYAKALFDVTMAEANPRVVEQQLAAVVDLMRTHAELGQVLTNPGVPAPRKLGVVKALVARAGTTPVLARTLELLASRDRLTLLPELLADYRARLRDREGVLAGEVTTATPLAPERLQRLQQSLGAVTGKQVTLAARVDPAIVGGVVARVGGTVYDGSLATQLQRLKDTLTGRGR